ncbi:MAG TPA: VOC family protein [Sphingomicrobium sp.]|nr:VOC family protein [Sphingomicrobium sp.]
MSSKIAPCLWFNGQAEEAANFYASVFKDSRVKSVHRAPGDYPAGKKGDVLTVEFTVLGMDFLGLNGGPQFKFDEAISFQVYTDDQEETDRYWDAIVGNGGEENVCGWCKDRFGLSWQITPKRLMELMSAADPAKSKAAFDAMMQMRKIDIAALDRAVESAPIDA